MHDALSVALCIAVMTQKTSFGVFRVPKLVNDRLLGDTKVKTREFNEKIRVSENEKVCFSFLETRFCNPYRL